MPKPQGRRVAKVWFLDDILASPVPTAAKREQTPKCQPPPGQVKLFLKGEPVDSRIIRHTRNYKATGWRLPANEENRTAKDVLTSDELRTRAAINANHDAATMSIGDLIKSLVSTGNTPGVLSKVNKDVIDEILEGTLGILCIEEMGIIIERMKRFRMIAMEEARNSGTCPDAERGLLRKAISHVRSGFESRLKRFRQQSPIGLFPREEAVIPPRHEQRREAFHKQGIDWHLLGIRYFPHFKRKGMQTVASSIDRYLEGLSYRLSALELDDIRRQVKAKGAVINLD
ncbi:hypothetical protein DL769_002686 [Monosporascus sp. CRB-8-3]|nr:hypothetical protein DL769_002686 [Monosporascus sp. CRB-8-3]